MDLEKLLEEARPFCDYENESAYSAREWQRSHYINSLVKAAFQNGLIGTNVPHPIFSRGVLLRHEEQRIEYQGNIVNADLDIYLTNEGLYGEVEYRRGQDLVYHFKDRILEIQPGPNPDAQIEILERIIDCMEIVVEELKE
jgi:hypothetical protein